MKAAGTASTGDAFDTLAASLQLRNSGMPMEHAEATVSVVANALEGQVTKKFMVVEMDRRFGEVDKRFGEVDRRFGGVDQRFCEVDRQLTEVQASISVLRADINAKIFGMGFTIILSQVAVAGTLFAAISAFG